MNCSKFFFNGGITRENVRLGSSVEASLSFKPGAIWPSSDTTVEFHLGYPVAMVSSRHTVGAWASICWAMHLERLNAVRVVEATPSDAAMDM